MAPMLDPQPSVKISQYLLARPLKLAIHPTAITASRVTTVQHLRSSEGLFAASELVEVQEF
jgi:hypothetical protein